MGWMGSTCTTGRSAAIAAALVLLLGPTLPALPAPPALPAHPALQTSDFRLQDQPPSFRSASSELVVLPVVVTDKQNRFISDLARERFVVFDNGRKVPVELFTNEDAPATIGLIIDASGSMRKKLAEVLVASLAFAKTSNPHDELFALRFNDDVRDAVADHTFLMAENFVALEKAIGSLRAEGRTSLYDALIAGLDHLKAGSRARKALVVISDGGDNASESTLAQVLARARESNAAIYTVGIYDDDDTDKNPGVLKSLARTTGGERFLPRSPGELLQACERIARDIRSGYTLGYVPPDRDGVYHRVRVEIAPADARRLSVRTRPGYFAAGHASQP
jgi:Ca-activated chloride channel family protein